MSVPDRHHRLQALREQTQQVAAHPRRWGDVVDEAQAGRRLIAALTIAGTAASSGDATGRDALALGLDVLRDPLYESDPMRADLIEAFDRWGPGAARSADLDALVEWLHSLDEATLGRTMRAVRGAAFELRVEEMLRRGELAVPDGAVEYVPTSFTEPGVDGLFLDADGRIVAAIQLKAAGSATVVARHLADHPDVPVWATTEAATDATIRGIGGVVDTGVSIDDLMPPDTAGFVDVFNTSMLESLGEVAGDFPVIGLALVGAELATVAMRGGDMPSAMADARTRAGRMVTWASLGTAASLATGAETARIVVTVGGRLAHGALTRAETDIIRDVNRLAQQREIVGGLLTVTPVAN